MPQDEIDTAIIHALRADARMPNAALAKRVGLSASACLRRLRMLERDGTIRGYTVLLDASAASGLVVMTQIELERQTEDYLNRFEAAVRRCPDIQDCYLMTGSSDYLLKIRVADAGEYERLHRSVLSKLPGVSRIQSSFTIRSVVGR
ncbi:Lrp/AsnC family transcriptional regulator [Methylobacterium mesophilicum]|jgi:DNA-binding Lrp family transcriptional regulator|uniref:Lrp/AsnC family transcriptional regulator n=1 Tax=Methylobacterium TaxID=407 RepID=UPI0011C8BEE7|nr:MULTISPECIES: Lrp/AsnC family transcriptional regulator [Methylobacterium]TXN46337.1 Lrp/AsnC family transcriptional regulator [Methylobacterium sp. WL7]TXN75021.1 Lrp/AsnC family transcriptional regulator [Methylobacterium sp. WL18]GJE24137.1 Leucine-responsive regulatory protein [Methylobacterium mesophilicum]